MGRILSLEGLRPFFDSPERTLLTRRAQWLARHKAPNYAARAGQTIAGNLVRGGDGKFTSGSGGGEAAKPSPKAQQRAERQQARANEAQAEADTRAQEDAALDAAKPGKERAKLRAQIAKARRDRANARRQARAAEAQAAANAPPDAKPPKEEKPKKGGGGGGKAPKEPKPTDDEKRAEADKQKRARATATAQQAGLAPDAPDALRTARDEGGVTNPALLKLGLIDAAGDATDQGRRAIAALERGDIGSYRAALQDASARLKREALAAKRQAARDAAQAARDAGRVREAPTEGAQQRRSSRYGKRYVNIPSRKGFAVFKDTSGADRWLAITTTAYKDQDNEYISREALKGAVRWGDRGQERGVLRYWHVPGFDLGACDFQATTADDKLLIESGTFNSPAAAQLGHRMAAKGWQMSPGFLHPPDEPRDGVYDHILIFERSACPPGRASNPYTRFLTEDAMDDTKLQQLKELTADNPDLLTALLETATKTDKRAVDAGAVYKDAPEWAQALISRIDALEAAKAFPPAAAETKADPAAEMLDAVETLAPEAELEVEEMDDGPLLTAAEIESIAAAVLAKIAPLLDVEKKIRAMADEIKGSMGGMASKDDTTAQLTKIETRLKTLEGDQPIASGYRASQDSGTALPAALVEALKAQPHSVTPTGAPQTSGNPVADFLSSFNIGGR